MITVKNVHNGRMYARNSSCLKKAYLQKEVNDLVTKLLARQAGMEVAATPASSEERNSPGEASRDAEPAAGGSNASPIELTEVES